MEKDLEQQPSTCIKVVLYGPESTGKTTLAKQLAKFYKTQWVPEFARPYLQKKHNETGLICQPEDLIPIAKGQIKLENELTKSAQNVLFCDTNLLQTYFYGKAYYQDFKNPVLKKYAFKHTYDHYFLTNIDTPWQKDDLRDKPHQREEMFIHFKNSLEENNFAYTLLSGNKEERFAQAKEKINELLKSK